MLRQEHQIMRQIRAYVGTGNRKPNMSKLPRTGLRRNNAYIGNKTAMPNPFIRILLLGLILGAVPFSFGQENPNPLPKKSLTGKVTSEKGEALAGVLVEWEGGDAQYTDKDGRYGVQYEDRPVVHVCCNE